MSWSLRTAPEPDGVIEAAIAWVLVIGGVSLLLFVMSKIERKL